MKRTICALLLVSGLALAAGGDYQLGLSAYDRGDYAEALAQWLPLAEGGDPEARYRVGRLYYYGRGVEQDYAQAGQWYLEAAESGHARSQSNVAVMYEQGRGFPADDSKAAKWYAKAAEQGRPISQNNLGRLYEEGRGVAQSDERAVGLYTAAAKKGYAEAQYRLGRMYETGRGVTQDSKKAQKWYRKASNNGYDVTAATSSTGDVPATSSKPAAPANASKPEEPAMAAAAPTVAAAAAEAETESDEEAADNPIIAEIRSAPEATGDLAEGIGAYERGDYSAAADLWRPLAEDGDTEAQYLLGELYRLGQGVPEDDAAAGRWHLEAAEHGHPRAMYYVALMYYRGRGSEWEKDYARAYVWFTLAAEAGIGDAAWWRDRLGSRLSEREAAKAKDLLADLEKN